MPKKKTTSSQNEKRPVVLLPSTKEGVLAVLASNLSAPMSNTEVLNRLQKADEAVGRKKTSLGTFYPTVKRLENEGLIKGSWGEEVAPGAKQRFLAITGAGLEVFNLSRQYRAVLEEDTSTDKEKSRSMPGLTFSADAEGGTA